MFNKAKDNSPCSISQRTETAARQRKRHVEQDGEGGLGRVKPSQSQIEITQSPVSTGNARAACRPQAIKHRMISPANSPPFKKNHGRRRPFHTHNEVGVGVRLLLSRINEIRHESVHFFFTLSLLVSQLF